VLLDATPPGLGRTRHYRRASACPGYGIFSGFIFFSSLVDGKRHFFSHGRAMFIAQVSISLSHQQAAVFMSQPTGNRFEVNPGFIGVATKEMP
jgi:hypothetical protein